MASCTPLRPDLRRVFRIGSLLLPLAACSGGDGIAPTDPGPAPAPPAAFDAFYYAHSVHLSWELGPGWNGESFRIYGKRVADAAYVLVAQVTNCRNGVCSYRDVNVAPGTSYRYYVASVGGGGVETATPYAVDIEVPIPTPPPVPGGLEAVALDGVVYLRWNDQSRTANDFAFYRVYFASGDQGALVGETDSEGFLDGLVQNGNTYAYFVTAVDDRGHESAGSPVATATPRPDYHGEFLYAWEDRPGESGFRFQESEEVLPVVPGNSAARHFRLEVDQAGWWFVPGPGVGVHGAPQPTRALRCGPAADQDCTDLHVAPQTGYQSGAIEVIPGYSYVFRVPADGGGWRYGVVRVSHAGFAQDGAIALFDWAFQLQSGNRNLSPPAP